jgi:hypothetical protein
MITTAEIVTQLERLIIDLYWVSESDCPFQVVIWDEKDLNKLLSSTSANEEIETISLADFFAPALVVEDWYEEEELATIDRYKKLLNAIEFHLNNVKVFRVGKIEIDVYILGKTATRDVIGLQTQVVET